MVFKSGFIPVKAFAQVHVERAAFLYVDDGLCLLPSTGPLIAAISLPFMCALGVPFSWEKMSLGQDFVWLGWCFSPSTLSSSVPEPKKTKLLVTGLSVCACGTCMLLECGLYVGCNKGISGTCVVCARPLL